MSKKDILSNPSINLLPIPLICFHYCPLNLIPKPLRTNYLTFIYMAQNPRTHIGWYRCNLYCYTTLGYIYNPLTEKETYDLITKAL